MKELNTALQATITEKQSIKGTLGVGVDYYKGKDGYTPIKGVDYFTKEDIAEIKKGIEGADLSEYPKKKDLAIVATSGSYTDLKDKPTFNGDYNSLTNKPELFSGSYNDLTNKPDLFSGDYNDLTNKPTIPEAPDLTGYAKTADLSTVAASGSYEDLTNKPTIPDAYTLPTASTDTLGGVKVDGSTITIADGVISSAGGGGSVSVDGTSIIQNEDGTISTALKTTSDSITGANLINLGTGNTITDYNGCTLWNSIIQTGGQTFFQNTKNIYRSILFTFNGISYSSRAGNSISYCLLMGNEAKCYSKNDSESHAFGMGQYVNTRGNQFVIGKANITDDKAGSTPSYYFIIGNGTDRWDNARSNALTVDPTGNLAIAGTMSSAGADYAEFFEWKDGNPTAQDRVGYIVTLDGDKLTFANEGDYILGVVSGTATVLGDNPEWNWAKRWITDDFGRIQYEDVVIHHEAEERNGETIPAWDEPIKAPIVNPDYNPDQEYTKRADRPEWSAVGMMGKLYVRDDGTCKVNGYAKPINGVATASTSGTMRVIERISDNVIRVVIK